MAATVNTSAANNHVENVSPNEWEDETSVDDQGDMPVDGVNVGKPSKGKPLKNAAAMLRSSFGALRIGSVTERPPGKPAPSKSGRRESSTGFVGTLLHGLANAVGLHRDGSPDRDVSPLEPVTCHSKLLTSQFRTVGRLSSAAMMRAELQNYSQFGDLRNDSFSSPTATKLMRRSSLPRASDASVIIPRAGFQSGASGDLSQQSSPGPYLSSTRTTCPGELPSPCHNPATPRDPRVGISPSQHATREAILSGCALDGRPMPRRSTSGAAPPPSPPCTLDVPRLASIIQPHPPVQPRPNLNGASPAASRSVSTDHLPPMQPVVSPNSVRDRPATPRGRTSNSGSSPSKLAQVLGSLHLPEILTGGSGKSVTERRSSVIGGGSGLSFTRAPDVSVSRGRRSSVSGPGNEPLCGSGPSMTPRVAASGPSTTVRVSQSGGSTTVRGSDGSFHAGGSAVMGPGGAAISASIAKRAAVLAAASGGGGGSGGSCLVSPVSPVTPSAVSATAMLRPSGLSVTARVSSITGKPPQLVGGILQDFHSSLELEEDSALAAVEAEFDRRFGHSVSDVPGSIDAVQLQLPRQFQEMQPHAPKSERTTPQHFARRPGILLGDTSAHGGSGGGGPVVFRATRRQSCSATMTCEEDDEGRPDHKLMASMDVVPDAERSSLNTKMRLASIRLSYAEGIVNGTGPAGARASLDLQPAPQPRVSATAWAAVPGNPQESAFAVAAGSTSP